MTPTTLLIGIVGDSGAGKSTIATAIGQRIGAHRVTAICLDDYHRYDRAERKRRDITALAPEANRLDLMAEHLHAFRRGESVTKPVYRHTDGTFGADEHVTPRGVVIARGLLSFHTDQLRMAFDILVYLDPAEALRLHWKTVRDCAKRGYTADEVRAHVERRRADSERFVQPQRAHADIVIAYAPSATPGADAPLELRIEERPRAATAERGTPARAELVGAVLAAAERARWPLAASDVPRTREPVLPGGVRRETP
jgi:phosphoribulokinase